MFARMTHGIPEYNALKDKHMKQFNFFTLASPKQMKEAGLLKGSKDGRVEIVEAPSRYLFYGDQPDGPTSSRPNTGARAEAYKKFKEERKPKLKAVEAARKSAIRRCKLVPLKTDHGTQALRVVLSSHDLRSEREASMRARHTKSAAGRVEGGQQRRAHTAQGRSRTRGGRGGRDGHAHTTAAAGASGSSSSASGATKDGAEGGGTSAVMEQGLMELSETLEFVSQQRSQLVNVSRDVARASTELQTSVLGAEEAVSERFRQLHAMLHERETSLKRQLAGWSRDRLQGFATAAERLSDAMHELDEAAQGVQRCIMRAQQGQSDGEFAEAKHGAQSDVENAINGQKSSLAMLRLQPPPPAEVVTAVFDSNAASQLEAALGSVGDLVIRSARGTASGAASDGGGGASGGGGGGAGAGSGSGASSSSGSRASGRASDA